MFSNQIRYIEKLFEIFQKAHLAKNANRCKLLAQIFKRLISIDQKPDITLFLLSNAHYQDLFTCLSYLDENKDKICDFEAFFARHVKFNNYLGLTNQEVLDNINNNFRISFLKDFVCPRVLSDRQLEELNTFLILHNNTIICHIDSIMRDKMQTLDRMIEERPKESLDFFTEFFTLLRSSFADLKASFAFNFFHFGIHEKVISVFLKSLNRKKTQPVDVSSESCDYIIQVCTEIIGFLCRNHPKSVIRIFDFKINGVAFIECLPEWITLTTGDCSNQILDLFRILPAAKNETLDQDCLLFFKQKLVPFLSFKLKQMAIDESFHINAKFVNFCTEIFSFFFTFKNPKLCEALVEHNFLVELCQFHGFQKTKKHQLSFLKYLNENLTYLSPQNQEVFDWEIILLCFWNTYLRIISKRDNLIRSLGLAIIQRISFSKNTTLVELFLKIAGQNPSNIDTEEIISGFFNRHSISTLPIQSQSQLELPGNSVDFKIDSVQIPVCGNEGSVLIGFEDGAFQKPKVIASDFTIGNSQESNNRKLEPKSTNLYFEGNSKEIVSEVNCILEDNLLKKRNYFN